VTVDGASLDKFPRHDTFVQVNVQYIVSRFILKGRKTKTQDVRNCQQRTDNVVSRNSTTGSNAAATN
jgi:hypothetical protein